MGFFNRFLDEFFGRKPGSTLPAYREDHRVPERRLVHAFLALYTGNDGDPKHTMSQQANIDHLQQGWTTPDAAELVKLMDRYEVRGECNTAFDLIRAIKLARHGAGAGWISDDESWQRCYRCAARLKQKYQRWEDVYVDFQAGRVDWYKGVGKPIPPDAYQYYAQRYAEANVLVLSQLPLNR
jgi:hypothetical protein